MLFATLARKEQAPHAILLADTIKKHHPEARMVLCLVDHHIPAGLTSNFDEVLLVSGQGYPVEESAYSGPTKGYLLSHLINRYPDDLIYLDPETLVYGRFEELYALLEHYPIIAAPHNLEPYHRDQDHREIERLRHGFIDSGLLALKNTERTRQFLRWWSDKLNRTTLGSSRRSGADQLWLSLGKVPHGVHILKEPGYQYAAWNWHEGLRRITGQDGTGIYLNNGKRLRSFATAGARERLQEPPFPIPEQIRSAVKQLLDTGQQELDRILQSLP